MAKCKAIHYLAVLPFLAPSANAEDVAARRMPAYNQQMAAAYYYEPAAGVEPQNSPQVPQYAAPQEAKQYAMRPPAPYYGTDVPYAQQKKIESQRRNPVLQQPQVYTPPPQVYTPPPAPVPVQQPEYHAPAPIHVEAPEPVYTAPTPVIAEPEEDEKILGGDVTGSLGVTSDYVFRGVTQSREVPAVQGGLEYQHDTGVYVGLWVSNVDFKDGDQAQIETDAYGGYRTQVTDNISADAGLLYYAYPGADKNLNYDYYEAFVSGKYELPLEGGFGSGFDLDKPSIGASFYYSPEFFAESGTAYYLKATATTPFQNGVTLDGHIGKQWVKDNLAYALPDYMDWSLGIAYALPKEFGIKLQYLDTNLDKADCADGCDAKGVATLSKTF